MFNDEFGDDADCIDWYNFPDEFYNTDYWTDIDAQYDMCQDIDDFATVEEAEEQADCG